MSWLGWYSSRVDRRWRWLGFFIGAVIVLQVIVITGEALGGALDFRPWEGTTEEQVTKYGEEQCELVNTKSFIVQKANFWSNVGFLAVGLIIFNRNENFLSKGTGVALIILFVGSSLFHGTLTSVGQFLDIAGIYMALVALGFYGVFQVWELDETKACVPCWFCWAMAVGAFAGLTKNILPWHDSTWGSIILGMGLFVIGVCGAFRFSKNWKRWWSPALWAVLSFGAAVFFKFGDGKGHVLCSTGGDFFAPKSLLQGHALWHVLAAVMMLCVFEYYTSLRGKWQSVWPWRG